MIELLYIVAGAVVGLAVGLTGVGGGSLMTPFLILFGIPYHIAIGTDLLYASITKAGGMVSHARQKTIEWRIMGFLALGQRDFEFGVAFLPVHAQGYQCVSAAFHGADELMELASVE